MYNQSFTTRSAPPNLDPNRRATAPPGFAVVKRVTERATGKAYAVKIMSLPTIGAEPTDNESTRWVGGWLAGWVGGWVVRGS